ncbi:MAG: HAMP domain-containing protein, partial [Pseudolysinimonas sp.]
MRVDWRNWRDWPRRLARVWGGSLRIRTVAITVLLSAIAITVIGAYISTSVSSNLFEQRLSQITTEASKATTGAQQVFTQAAELSETADLESVEDNATNAIRATVSSQPLIAILRVPHQSGPSLMENRASEGFEALPLSAVLEKSVRDGGVSQLSWQSLRLPNGSTGQSSPGIVVGSLLEVPTAGDYQLYLVYDLSDVQQTLDFVQRTLVLGGLALVLLIGAVAYLIVRLIVGPVRRAAETSEKLAAGHLEERLRVRGDDELAILARSFNRMADSMQGQIRQLADLSRLQQRFVSDVSHELRTPLTTIRLAGDVLYDQ